MSSLRKANSGSFKVGNPGGGRPRGARSRLHELAIEMLRADFEQHGEETIKRVRERKPEVYLTSVVSLLPKQQEKLETPFIDLSDSELQQLEELLASLRAKTVKAIEEHKINSGARIVIEPKIEPDAEGT